MKPSDPELRRARAAWSNRGERRPPFAHPTEAGQESVWDYPRPPRLVPDGRLVIVRAGDVVIAETRRAKRLLETASPPTFYVPPDDVDRSRLQPADGRSTCEWKGEARYHSVDGPSGLLRAAAWEYPRPYSPYEELAGFLSFYPATLACWVDGERVRPQAGGFYGGWVTSEIVGPFKGEPGTGGW